MALTALEHGGTDGAAKAPTKIPPSEKAPQSFGGVFYSPGLAVPLAVFYRDFLQGQALKTFLFALIAEHDGVPMRGGHHAYMLICSIG